MSVRYLTLAQVLEIHRRVVGQRAGKPARPQGLASAVELPRATMFGEDLYPTIWLKAATMLRSIAENQPFVDGNKRTAWVASLTFLDINGYEVVADADAVERLMLDLAEKRADVQGIADFFERHAQCR